MEKWSRLGYSTLDWHREIDLVDKLVLANVLNVEAILRYPFVFIGIPASSR